MNWSDKALATIPELTPWEGCETCAFLVGKEGSLDVLEVWPTPSLTPSPENYSIGKRAWEGAKKRARSLDMVVIGTIHTHPLGPEGPSPQDEACACFLRPPDRIRAVWHPKSGKLTTYNGQGVLDQRTLPRSLKLRLFAFWALD